MRSCSRSAAGVCATVLFGLMALTAGEETWNRLMSPQPASARPAHSKPAAAQPRRPVILSRRPATSANPATLHQFCELIPAEHFDLPHPEHVYSRAPARLDPAADPNPAVFEGFEGKSRCLEPRDHAP